MIVKNLLAVGIIATAATVASAADEAKATWKINGKVRMDAVQSTTEVKPTGVAKTTTKSSGMNLKRAAFTLTGESGADALVLEYYAETNYLENAYIKHKLADNISLTLGKIDTLAQSWENDYSDTDQYLVSWAGAMAPSATEGLQVSAGFGDHSVALQVLQGIRKMGAGTAADPEVKYNEGGGLTAALQYRGNINNMIRPIVTYTSVRTAGTKMTTGGVEDTTYSRGNGYQTQLGLGVQFETAGLVADLEYDTVKTMKKKWIAAGSEPTPTTNKDSDTNSIVLQARYAIGMTTPFLKVTSNTTKNGQEGNATDKTGMGLGLGVEHKLDGACRLHAVYVSDNYSMKVNANDSTKYTMTSINLGVTAAM